MRELIVNDEGMQFQKFAVAHPPILIEIIQVEPTSISFLDSNYDLHKKKPQLIHISFYYKIDLGFFD